MGIVVVGMDFEEGSRAAIEAAKAEAVRMGAEVVLVHVEPLPVFAYPGFEPPGLFEYPAEIAEATRRSVDELARRHGVRGEVLTGDPAEEILARAKELSADLVVMGTHGRSGLSHFLLGSVTEKVIRKSPVPVLVVPIIAHAA